MDNKGYQAKHKINSKPPKTGSVIDNAKFEKFIKLCMEKFRTDKVIICFEDRNWGIQPIKIDEKGDITEVMDGVAYYRASKEVWNKESE